MDSFGEVIGGLLEMFGARAVDQVRESDGDETVETIPFERVLAGAKTTLDVNDR